MYYNTQTLYHLETHKLVRLAGSQDTAWAWEVGHATRFFDEEGKPFVDDIGNYGPIRNELDQIEPGLVKGRGPDLSLKKYVGVDLKELQAKTLKRMEDDLLERMKKDKNISSAFCTRGNQCWLFRTYFLERRKAIPLYRRNNSEDSNLRSWMTQMISTTPIPEKASSRPEWMDGPLTFIHEGERWLVSNHSANDYFCVITDLVKD